MHEIRTEIQIHARSEHIWSILVDFPSHPQWNPFVRRIEGVPKTGETLTVAVQPEGGKGMTFRPTVVAATPNREFRWRGKLLLPGIFDGEHYFRIEPLGPDVSNFIHGEVFTGILVPVLKSGLNAGVREGFMAMNLALKKRAEHSAPTVAS